MLLQQVVPSYVGNSGPYANTADLYNRGFEIELGWNKQVGEVSFRVAGNASFIKNEVTLLGADKDYLPSRQTITPQSLEVTRVAVGQSVDSFFERFDVLVTPTMAVLPPAHGTLDYDGFAGDCRDWLREIFTAGPFTAAFNVSGHPAISVPTGFSRGGLPIGVQLVGAHGRDALLLQLAAQLEQAMPWSGRVPSVYAD